MSVELTLTDGSTIQADDGEFRTDGPGYAYLWNNRLDPATGVKVTTKTWRVPLALVKCLIQTRA